MLGSSTIAIMSKGQLVALGSPIHLKQRFGAGYSIRMVTPSWCAGALKATVGELLPEAKLQDDSAGSLVYGIPTEAISRAKGLLEYIEQLAKTRADGAGQSSAIVLSNWLISQSTLEDVFIRLAREPDGGAPIDSQGLELQVMDSPTTSTTKEPILSVLTPSLPVAVDSAEAGPNATSLAAAEPLNMDGAPRASRGKTAGGAHGAIRAVLRKNASLLSRQKVTMCCNLLLPALFLVAALLVQILVLDPKVKNYNHQVSVMKEAITTACDEVITNTQAKAALRCSSHPHHHHPCS